MCWSNRGIPTDNPLSVSTYSSINNPRFYMILRNDISNNIVLNIHLDRSKEKKLDT